MSRNPNNLVDSLNFWREYPKRDVEFVRWYPCRLAGLSPREIFKNKEGSFYVHIPFCNNVCISCPYNKFNTKTDVVERYLSALKKEIDLYVSEPYVQGMEFTSGYFGGGTPTSLTAKQWEDLLAHMQEKLTIHRDASITVETTPVDITTEKLKVLKKYGVNRISVGVQSMSNKMLANIGRNYDAGVAMDALKMINEAGFSHVCVDLMWGLPGQTMEDWLESIRVLADSGLVEVFSIYQYMVIPSSPLYFKIQSGMIPKCPDDAEQEKLYWAAVQKFHDYGYKSLTSVDFVQTAHYEIGDTGECIELYSSGEQEDDSIIAATASIAKHITQSWYFGGDMMALGAGAFGYLNHHMYLNEPDLEEYEKKIEEGHMTAVMGTYVSLEERMAKMMVMGLRFLRVYRKDFIDLYGVDMMMVFGDKIKTLVERELVTINDEYIQVTYPKGWYYMENISKTFYTDNNRGLPQPSSTSTNLLQLLK